MGFHSCLCNGCGKPIIGHYALDRAPVWMTRVVAWMPDGTKIEGVYDGYGRAIPYTHHPMPFAKGPFLLDEDAQWVDVWHQECSHARHGGYLPARHAECQGWFFQGTLFHLTPMEESCSG